MIHRVFLVPLACVPLLALGTPAAAHDVHDHMAAPQAAPAPGDAGNVLQVPPADVGEATLEARARGQQATAGKFKVPMGFKLTDQLVESGIGFVHHIVDDAGKTYKAAHYDHGNGIAAADVNNDGLTDLYFPDQLGSNELWLNQGDGKFKNAADAALAMAGRISVSASFADIDNDGDQDLYVTTVRMGNALFENDGKGRFKDISKAAGVDYVGHSSGAVFLDYDRDGLLDLFVVNVGKYTTERKGRGGYYIAYEDAFQGHLKPERTERSVLYRNLGKNRFEDVSAKVGLLDGGWSGDATVTDFNQDGYPDLYVLNMQGDDHYWENQGGQRFVDRTAEVFPKTSWGAMGVKAFDYDNDGDLDLFVTDMHSDMAKDAEPQDEKRKSAIKGVEQFFERPENNVFGNSFYRNQGNGSFQEVSDELGLENYWPWGLSTGDLNADGWQDVLITSSMNYPFRYGVNSLMINNQGEGFLDSEFLLGIEPRREGKIRKPWYELDCSGEDQAHRLCQGRAGRFTVTGTYGSRSSVIFDVEGDGDLDIVTQEFNSEPQVFVSDLAQKRKVNFLQVRLAGRASNRNGIGALVKVTAGGKTYTQMMDGASGYLSHSVLPLYFGLGEASRVDRVEVLWPSGRKQTAGPIAAGRTLDITEAPAKK